MSELKSSVGGSRGRGRRALDSVKGDLAVAKKETVVELPRSDMGRIIGKQGSTKRDIEEKCSVELEVRVRQVDLRTLTQELGKLQD